MNCAKCNFPHPPCELIDGLCHRCTAAKSKVIEDHLANLLARIHRDDGSYLETHGLPKAVKDADEIVVGWLERVA